MRITPLDIRKQEFRKGMRGLDADEVYAFLNTVAEEYETVLSDNKRLREKIVELEERLKEFKSMETNLRNTLLTAERITSEAKENARKEAGLIVREAEVEAEKAAEAIRAHTTQLRREILELKKHKDNYITRIRTLLESHQNVINGFEEDFAEVDLEIEKIGRQVEQDSNAAITGARMSREKITEDYAHEPKDKFVWEDEQKREDVPRPSMPAPGEAGQAPGRKEAGPEDSMAQDQPAAAPEAGEPKDQPGLGLEEGSGGTASNAEDESKVEFCTVDAENVEIADEKDPGTNGHFNEKEVSEEVAHKIEDTLYPEADIHEVDEERVKSTKVEAEIGYQAPLGEEIINRAQAQQAASQAAQGQQPSPSAGAATAVGPEQPGAQAQAPTGPQQSDDWKSYEVNKEKPDWSNYEIAGKPAAAKAPPSDTGPSDKEVENALSGLAEISIEEDPQPRMPEVEAKPAPESQAEPKAPASPQAQPSPQAVKPAEQKPESPESDDGPSWSMEELRKNLSNIDRE